MKKIDKWRIANRIICIGAISLIFVSFTVLFLYNPPTQQEENNFKELFLISSILAICLGVFSLTFRRGLLEISTLGLGAIAVAVGLVGSSVNSRVLRNEASAMYSLKVIARGQEHFKKASFVDLNANGIGEYAFLPEMSLSAGIRIDNVGKTAPFVCEDAHCIPLQFGNEDSNGVSSKCGYYFCCFIPASSASAVMKHAETVNVQLAEKFFIAYAWPQIVGRSGIRTFVIDSNGKVYFYASDGHNPLFSDVKIPSFDAALKLPEWGSGIDEGGPGQTGGKIKWVKYD